MKTIVYILAIGTLCALVTPTDAITAAATIDLAPITDEIIDTSQDTIQTPIHVAYQTAAPLPPYLRITATRWPTPIKLSPTALTQSPGDCTLPPMPLTDDLTLCADTTYYSSTPGTTLITIDADDVTLDCNGATLEDITSQHLTDGVYVYPGRSGITVKNCTFKNFFVSVWAGSENTSLGTIADLTVTNNTFINQSLYWADIYLAHVTQSSVTNNVRSADNDDGYWWPDAYFTILTAQSSDNTIAYNTTHNNKGVHIFQDSSSNEIHHNTFDWAAQGGPTQTTPPGVAVKLDRGAHDNHIHHNTIRNENTYGGELMAIQLDGFPSNYNPINPAYRQAAYNNLIEDNTIRVENYTAAVAILHDAHHNTIRNNNIEVFILNGLYFQYQTITDGGVPTHYFPHDNTATGNTIVCPTGSANGISLANGTSHTTLTDNDISYCQWGIRVMYYQSWPDQAPQVPISDVTISHNHISYQVFDGVAVSLPGVAVNWHITENYFYHNGWYDGLFGGSAVYMHDELTGTVVTGNTFVENGYHSMSDSYYQALVYEGVADVDGRGNYYSDYDEPSEGCADVNSDGICDEPLFLAGTVTDHYPLTTPTVCDNCPPAIAPIDSIAVDERQRAVITINATDPEGDALTYWVDDPRFVDMSGCWPGRHSFAWFTDEHSAGTYLVNAMVSDGTNVTQLPVSVTVRDTCRKNKWGIMHCTSIYESIACY